MTVTRGAQARRARSALFVPGDRPERFDKARAASPGLVIIDLEDGVPADNKAKARRAARSWLSAGGRGAVRVNGSDNPCHHDDLAAVAGCAGLDAVIVPKAADPDLLPHAADLGAAVGIVAMIETARGVLRAGDLASTSDVVRLAIGHLDLANDLGAAPTRDALLVARTSVVLVSRAAGIPGPLESVTPQLDDLSRTIDDARYARDLGFTGKLAVHPQQVAAIHGAFGPSSDEIDWATAVMRAAADGGAVRVGGDMVDEPVLERARRILAAGISGHTDG